MLTVGWEAFEVYGVWNPIATAGLACFAQAVSRGPGILVVDFPLAEGDSQGVGVLAWLSGGAGAGLGGRRGRAARGRGGAADGP